MPIQNKKKPAKHSHLFYGVLVAFLLVVAGGLVAKYTDVFKHPTADNTASSYTKGQPKETSSSSGSSATTSGSSSQSSQTGGTTSSTSPTTTPSPGPLAPSGDLVSDHEPNLSGSPDPNTMTSVCTSSPGASCRITFTMNGVTKSLPAQTIDSGGSTYWINWKLQTVGLSVGSWQVKATASLNGQSASTTDAKALVVSQ
jgi:hypothetical protein